LTERERRLSELDGRAQVGAQHEMLSASFVSSNLVTVFAFDDDYATGILSAFAHTAWLTAGRSTLEDRVRYTPSTVFATAPWPPQPSDRQREAVAQASR